MPPPVERESPGVAGWAERSRPLARARLRPSAVPAASLLLPRKVQARVSLWWARVAREPQGARREALTSSQAQGIATPRRHPPEKWSPLPLGARTKGAARAWGASPRSSVRLAQEVSVRLAQLIQSPSSSPLLLGVQTKGAARAWVAAPRSSVRVAKEVQVPLAQVVQSPQQVSVPLAREVQLSQRASLDPPVLAALVLPPAQQSYRMGIRWRPNRPRQARRS
jgi:hypothetical protein